MPECPICTAELEVDPEWPGLLYCWHGCYWASDRDGVPRRMIGRPHP